MKIVVVLTAVLAMSCSLAAQSVLADERDTLRQEAAAAMRKAAAFYTTKAAAHGGYLYYYSLDFSRRWGEGEATADQIWVQPPGTPAVGLALLRAYDATGDAFYLAAARQTAEALIYVQLKSGGWTYSVDFNPQGKRVAQYLHGHGNPHGTNSSTLDDGTSQSAIRFLARADEAGGFKHAAIHEAAQVALDGLLKAQFPNGGFPQRWIGPVGPQPIVKANFPAYDWRTEQKIKEYWELYTLNDGLAGHVASALEDAFEVYHDQKYRTALERLGDFLILAQLPDPQPAWAQQYNYAMQPAWARKFEPPAVTGSESQDAMETLLVIYRATGDERYLEPIPRALAYLRKSLLSDGKLARYYELKTNKPLYMERNGDKYSLTYADTDLPSHYGWKVDSNLPHIEHAYEAARRKTDTTPANRRSTVKASEIKQIIADLDSQGRWVSVYHGEKVTGQPKFADGFEYLSSSVFTRNLLALSRYLAETR